MAVSSTVTDVGLMGNKRVVLGTITFDSSYPTGGEAFDPDNIGLVNLEFISFSGVNGYLAEWDATNQKIIMRVTGTAAAPLADEDNATNLSTIVLRFFAIGT